MMVEGGGFEPPKAEPSDLQSDPFGHSGTPPMKYVFTLFLNRSLAMTYSHMGTPTLPSALLRFTSEFGMGSGGATVLLSLDKKHYNFESWILDTDLRQHDVLVTSSCLLKYSLFYA